MASKARKTAAAAEALGEALAGLVTLGGMQVEVHVEVGDAGDDAFVWLGGNGGELILRVVRGGRYTAHGPRTDAPPLAENMTAEGAVFLARGWIASVVERA